MGIIIFESPVAGIRGKVGGLIYSANKSGAYIKGWGRGSNPRTALQTAHRSSLIQFAQSWGAVSAENKTAWDVFAALEAQNKTNPLGETFSVSGFSWFVGININRANVGQAQLDTAPTVAIPGTPTIESTFLRTSAGGLTSVVRLTVGSTGLTDELAVYSKLFNSFGRLTASTVELHLTTDVPNAGRRVFYQPELESRYGDIFIGQRIFIEVATQNSDGRQGARASISVDATTS